VSDRKGRTYPTVSSLMTRSTKTTKLTYWQNGDYYLGFLNDYPDYQTQGLSKDELLNNLKDLLADLESGEVPYVRKVEDLAAAE
jgi:predicted RNase H-like HicB family nuclease